MREWIFKTAKPDNCSSFEHELETFESPKTNLEDARAKVDSFIRLDNVRFGDVIRFSEHYCGEVTKITRCNYCNYMKIQNCVESIEGILSDEITLIER